jgi:hypothetical protein
MVLSPEWVRGWTDLVLMTTSTRLACGKAMKKIPAGLTLNSYTDFLKSQMIRSSPVSLLK